MVDQRGRDSLIELSKRGSASGAEALIDSLDQQMSAPSPIPRRWPFPLLALVVALALAAGVVALTRTADTSDDTSELETDQEVQTPRLEESTASTSPPEPDDEPTELDLAEHLAPGWVEVPAGLAPEVFFIASTGDEVEVDEGGDFCADAMVMAARQAGPSGVAVGAYDLSPLNPELVSLGSRTVQEVDPPAELECGAGRLTAMRSFAMVSGRMVMLSLLAGAEASPAAIEEGVTILEEAPLSRSLSEPNVGQGWMEIPAPPILGRDHALTLWTGTELLVLAGTNTYVTGVLDPLVDGLLGRDDGSAPLATSPFFDGAAFDPVRQSWRTVAPPPAQLASAGRNLGSGLGSHWLWTGSEAALLTPDMDAIYLYDPADDRWRTVEINPSGLGVAQPGWSPTAVWADDQILLWGGFSRQPGAEPVGFALTLEGDVSELAAAPVGNRTRHDAVWTGTEMVTWGGTLFASDADIDQHHDALAYNPSTDTWRRIEGPNGSTTAFHSHLMMTEDNIVIVGQVLGGGGRVRMLDPTSGQWFDPSDGDVTEALGSSPGRPIPDWAVRPLLSRAGLESPLGLGRCNSIISWASQLAALWPAESCQDQPSPGDRSFIQPLPTR